jgi:hypothetical protein
MARPAPRPSVAIMMTTTRTRSIPQQASGDGSRIPLYRNPLRLAASASPWRSARYLAGHLAGGTTLAAASALVTAAGATAAATVAGISLLRPAASGPAPTPSAGGCGSSGPSRSARPTPPIAVRITAGTAARRR